MCLVSLLGSFPFCVAAGASLHGGTSRHHFQRMEWHMSKSGWGVQSCIIFHHFPLYAPPQIWPLEHGDNDHEKIRLRFQTGSPTDRVFRDSEEWAETGAFVACRFVIFSFYSFLRNLWDTGMGPLIVENPKIASWLGNISIYKHGLAGGCSWRGMPICRFRDIALL